MNFDLNLIQKSLKEKFGCLLINDFKYLDRSFVKSLKKTNDGVEYKYFEITEKNYLEEITDNLLLEELKSQYEENSDSEY